MRCSEIIWNIKNLKAKGKTSDDEQLSNSQWLFIIDYYRAKLIRQDMDRGKSLNPALIQNLGKVDIIITDKTDIGDISGCRIYKTNKILPSVIELNQHNMWTYVGPIGSSLPFQRTTFSKLVWDRVSTYTGNLTKWFEHNNKVYIATNKIINSVNIQGVFEHPIEVEKFLDKLDQFDPFDFEYPLSATMLDSLYKMIADAEFKILGMFPEDKLNDGNENS